MLNAIIMIEMVPSLPPKPSQPRFCGVIWGKKQTATTTTTTKIKKELRRGSLRMIHTHTQDSKRSSHFLILILNSNCPLNHYKCTSRKESEAERKKRENENRAA